MQEAAGTGTQQARVPQRGAKMLLVVSEVLLAGGWTGFFQFNALLFIVISVRKTESNPSHP